MKPTRCPYPKRLLALLSLATWFWIGSPAFAQSNQDNDTTIRDLASFDMFMDAHAEIAEQVRKDPSLVGNQEFVKSHPALQEYIQAHPGVTEEIRENPNAFMHQEQRFERRQETGEFASLNQFLDSHPEIAEQVRKDPALVNDKEFVKKHPALAEYLQTHAGVAQQWRQNPNTFMQQEQGFDRQDDARNRDNVRYEQDRFDSRGDRRDGDVTRAQLTSMDRFLDSHPEIAEQLRKDPSLVNDKKFVEHHPALQTYLQQNPGVREEFKENPNAFMHQEQRFDRREDRIEQRGQDFDRSRGFERNEGFERNQGFEHNHNGFDRDASREAASFGQFLGVHADIAAPVSKDPTLLNNKEFMETHPELQDYLKSHPAAQAQLQQNPQAFLQSAQQTTKPAPKAPSLPRPMQK